MDHQFNIEQKIYEKRVSLLFKESSLLIFGALLTANIVFYCLYTMNPSPLLIAWFSSVLLVTLCRYVSSKAYRYCKPSIEKMWLWHLIFIAITFWGGINWLLLGTALLPQDTQYQLIIAFSLSGMVAFTLPLFASCRWTSSLFLVLTLSGFGVNMLMQNDLPHQAVGLLTFIYLCSLLLSAQQVYRKRYTRIKLKIEKNLLIRKLSDVNHEIEIANSGLRSEIVRRAEVESKLRASEEQYRVVTNALPVLIGYVNADGNFEFSNNQYIKWVGKSLDQISGRSLKEILGEEFSNQFYHYMGDLRNAKSITFETALFSHDGAEHTVSVNLIPKFSNGEFSGVFSLISDMTPRMSFLSTHDPLTNLPNRSLFMSRLVHLTELKRNSDTRVVLMFLDLDHFKNVNDTLGHDVGDQLLILVVERLKKCIGKSDLLARLGGDEFTIILEDEPSLERTVAVAKQICKSVEKVIEIGGHHIFVTASIGINVYPDDAADAQTLIKNADLAMYRAKERGRNTFEFYTSNMQEVMQRKMSIENSLRYALERDEFKIYYQPFIHMKKNKITGLEALLRWSNHDIGFVSPSDFIPIAVERGMIVPIGEWVLRTACKQILAWQKMGFENLYLSVNLSARQFAQGDFIEMVARILDDTGLQGRYLVLELTETLIMSDIDYSVKMVKALKGLDITISLDDFGSGHASFGYLKRFPFDILKIDRQFMSDFSVNRDDAAIVKAVIALGHNLNMKVVAEGVEQPEQFMFLNEYGCDEFQGYLFYPPLPEIDVLLALQAPVGDRDLVLP